jgi:hypothetical protein
MSEQDAIENILPNSIEVHRNNKGEWSTTVKIYFGNTQEEAEAAKEWLDDLNLRLLITYAPTDIIQSEVMAAKLEQSLTTARSRTESSQPTRSPNSEASTRKQVVVAESLDRRVSARLAAEIERSKRNTE